LENEVPNRKLKWFLVVTSLIAGVAWILAAFDVFRGTRDFNLLYLGVGIVFIIAGFIWMLSLRSA
jgi:hypothetical protein